MKKRVLLAGLFHETHTFLDVSTTHDEFAVRRGDQMFAAAGDGSPLAGALEVAASCGWDVLPAADLRATPGGTVEDGVFEFFWREFTSAFDRHQADGIAGIFLVLHGAMVCQTVRDVEGALIERIRALPGAGQLPICGVLDLHGNISRRTIEQSQGFVAYRTNPHTDARQAAIDGAGLLDRILTSGRRPTALFEPTPVMWPPTGTGTADEPMRSLEAMAREIERDDAEIAAVNVMGGFSFADTYDTGVSFSAVTFGDAERARRRLRVLREYAIAHCEQGNVVEPPLSEAMPHVLDCIARGRTPVALVEPADNVGGGAPGDATTILRVLLAHRVDRAAVIINDPAAVSALADVALGGSKRLSIGGKGSRFTDPPLVLEVQLVSRSDGRFELEDRQSHLASMCGVRIEMGPCAVVRHGGVTILLTTRKTPPFDLGQLRSQGIEPETLNVIGIKAAVAHRRAYDRITQSSFTVSTPGPCTSDLPCFRYRNVRRPLFPLDPTLPGRTAGAD
ncbi:MAG TPA: M81 family metallopeptidase [Planctomycetaceae bacterium]|jgi:microcystin degradation protein MlrC|nr:M81 family metallopeptidase [Planctomycetaceae bacterium]